MPEIKNNFLQGKMNKDLDDRLLPNGQYRDAKNVKVSKSDNSDVGSVQNIKGNDYEYNSSYALSLSNTDTIGHYVDKLTGDVFWFVTNFTGSDKDDPTIIDSDLNMPGRKYARSQEDVDGDGSNDDNIICAIYHTKLGTGNEPTALINNFRLNFSKKHPILHINKIDDLLFWTDNYNQPRRINIKDALVGYYNTNPEYLEDKISVAQYAPPSAPKVTMSEQTASTVKSLHIKDKFVKFAYRFQYSNQEYSIISPFTQTCFHPGKGKAFNFGVMGDATKAGVLSTTEESDTIKETTVDSIQNLTNRVELFIDLPLLNTFETNHAACDINGVASGSSPYNIESVYGIISDTNVALTARGDKYIAAIGVDPGDGNGTSTLGTTVDIDAKTPLIDHQRLYFFTAAQITNYTNPLEIKKIQILYSESDSLALKVIETVDYDDITKIQRAEPISGNKAKLIHGFKFTYDSTKPIQTLPESELIRVADIAPVKAKTQEASGNRIIYGNFWQNRDITNLTLSKNDFDVSSGDQQEWNSQYLLSSVKSNREYSVGLVLSDRYGRHSAVYLPHDNTEFVDPKSGSVADWKHYSLKLNFSSTIGDVYHPETNPLGWYSYKVVVKQAEQEYYNVFAPTLVENVPSGNVRSWLTLHGDNINKVPRDVTDVNTETGTQGSQTRLLPKILDLSGTQTQQNGKEYIDVVSIGNRSEQGTGVTDFYLNDKDPLLAELPDGLGRDHSSGTVYDNLVVLETKPFSSALDIYYETSTAGLLSHLNEAIEESLGTVPNGITLSSSTINENVASGNKVADLTTSDTGGGTVSSPTYTILSIIDGNGTDRSGVFVIDGEDLDSAEDFEFKNTNEDTYTVRIKSTDSGNNSITQDKTISIGNIAPTITTGGALSLAASTSVNTAVRTVTAVNGSVKSGSTTNNLTFSITSGNTDNDFAINSTTGVITVAKSLTSGDTYNLTVQVSDAGGLTNSGTIAVTITSSSYNSFYISEGETVCGSEGANVCSLAVGIQKWHSGSGTTPSEGDTVYNDSQGSTVYNGGGYCYAWSIDGGAHNGSGTSYYGTISTAGVVVVGSLSLCSI